MAYSKSHLLPPFCPLLDTRFLSRTFQHCCLAAAPHAANAVDPLVYHGPEEQEEIPLLFTDLLDPRFREPKDILLMSKIAQGVKS
jgi:hypothetical protein